MVRKLVDEFDRKTKNEKNTLLKSLKCRQYIFMQKLIYTLSRFRKRYQFYCLNVMLFV